MSRELKTEVTINATPEKIWEVLVDFNSYPSWNPFITLIEGSAEVGQRIKAHIIPKGSKGMTFKPNILVSREHQELKWLGKLFFKGLFDGTHQFLIIDNGDGTALFQQNEKFEGILVHLFPKRLYVNSKAGFEMMNRALKQKAESEN